MAITWSENQTDVNFADTSPADNVQTTAEIDGAANLMESLFVSVDWVDPASGGSDYADINLYGSSDSGTGDDTIPLYNRRVDWDGNSSAQQVSFMLSPAPPYLTVEFDNQMNGEITALDIVYAYRTI